MNSASLALHPIPSTEFPVVAASSRPTVAVVTIRLKTAMKFSAVFLVVLVATIYFFYPADAKKDKAEKPKVTDKVCRSNLLELLENE